MFLRVWAHHPSLKRFHLIRSSPDFWQIDFIQKDRRWLSFRQIFIWWNLATAKSLFFKHPKQIHEWEKALSPSHKGPLNHDQRQRSKCLEWRFLRAKMCGKSKHVFLADKTCMHLSSSGTHFIQSENTVNADRLLLLPFVTRRFAPYPDEMVIQPRSKWKEMKWSWRKGNRTIIFLLYGFGFQPMHNVHVYRTMFSRWNALVWSNDSYKIDACIPITDVCMRRSESYVKK